MQLAMFVPACLFLMLAPLAQAQLYGWTPLFPSDEHPNWIPDKHWSPSADETNAFRRFKGTMLTDEMVLINEQWREEGSTNAIPRAWRERHRDLYEDAGFSHRLYLDGLYLILASLAATDTQITRMALPVALPFAETPVQISQFTNDFPGLWADYTLQIVLLNDDMLDWDLYLDIMKDELDRFSHLPHIHGPLAAYLEDLALYDAAVVLEDSWKKHYELFTAFINVEVQTFQVADNVFVKGQSNPTNLNGAEYCYWIMDLNYHDYDQDPALYEFIDQTYVAAKDVDDTRSFIRYQRFHSPIEERTVWDRVATLAGIKNNYINIPRVGDARVLREPPCALNGQDLI